MLADVMQTEQDQNPAVEGRNPPETK